MEALNIILFLSTFDGLLSELDEERKRVVGGDPCTKPRDYCAFLIEEVWLREGRGQLPVALRHVTLLWFSENPELEAVQGFLLWECQEVVGISLKENAVTVWRSPFPSHQPERERSRRG